MITRERWEGSEQGKLNLMTKLCCTAPGKQNVSRDLMQGFDNSYIMF